MIIHYLLYIYIFFPVSSIVQSHFPQDRIEQASERVRKVEKSGCTRLDAPRRSSRDEGRGLGQITEKLEAEQWKLGGKRSWDSSPMAKLVGGLVAIFYFPIYWVANHPN